jgi:hypothetical protein
LDFEEYIVNLLAAFVHLRIFELFAGDMGPIKDGHPFIMKVSDRAPQLEYLSIPRNCRYYKRVGGELVSCDQAETLCSGFPTFADNW